MSSADRVKRVRTMSGMRAIVVVADGLQIAALGPYGNERVATPNFNRLATAAVVFDQHFADGPGAPIRRTRHAFPPDAADAGDWTDHLRPGGIEVIWSPARDDGQVKQSLTRMRRAIA
jgi:hypothetical protein